MGYIRDSGIDCENLSLFQGFLIMYDFTNDLNYSLCLTTSLYLGSKVGKNIYEIRENSLNCDEVDYSSRGK
jgi:hypothetical protein